MKSGNGSMDNDSPNEEITPVESGIEPLSDREIAIAKGGAFGSLESQGTVEESKAEPSIEAEAGTDAELEQEAGVSGDLDKDESTTSGGKDAADATDTRGKWRDDEETKKLAAAYGLDEGSLQDFVSRAELERFARLQDKIMMGSGKAVSSGAEQFVPESKAAVPTEENPEVALDPKAWEEEGYDEKTVGLVRFINQQQEQYRQIQQYIAYQQQVQQINTFHDAVDSLNDERFGKSFANGRPQEIPTDKSSEREKLYNAAAELQAGIVARAQQLGKEPTILPMPELIRRAYGVLYGAESAKKGILNQSKNRRPVASTRANAPISAAPLPKDASPDEIAKRIANDPRVVKAYSQAQRVNGVGV
jgi:hypothetical protein